MDDDKTNSAYRFIFPFRGREGYHYEYELEPELFLALARAGIFIANDPKRFAENFEMMCQLGRLGAFLDRGHVARSLEDHIVDFIYLFSQMAKDQEWKDAREPAMLLSYHLLAQKRITRTEAFNLAVQLLGADAPKSANSWRVRVDAYAKEHNLDPIGQPIRKPRPA